MEVKPTLLPIDECEEWIWEILDSTKDSGFEYITDEGKEFLIFNTNDFHADTKALYKIKKITGMRLAQIRYSQLLYSVVVLQIDPLTIKNGLSLTTYRLDGISIESFNVGWIIAKEWTYVSQGSMIKNFKEG